VSLENVFHYNQDWKQQSAKARENSRKYDGLQ
jgi:hypothetical protein